MKDFFLKLIHYKKRYFISYYFTDKVNKTLGYGNISYTVFGFGKIKEDTISDIRIDISNKRNKEDIAILSICRIAE